MSVTLSQAVVLLQAVALSKAIVLLQAVALSKVIVLLQAAALSKSTWFCAELAALHDFTVNWDFAEPNSLFCTQKTDEIANIVLNPLLCTIISEKI